MISIMICVAFFFYIRIPYKKLFSHLGYVQTNAHVRFAAPQSCLRPGETLLFVPREMHAPHVHTCLNAPRRNKFESCVNPFTLMELQQDRIRPRLFIQF